MGTRGAFGVIIGEKEKIGYNQYDSYPEGNGIANLEWLRGIIADGHLEKVKELANNAKLVSDEVPPTPEDIARLHSFTNLNVSEQSVEDWYCLTRDTHGDISAMLDCGYILDSADFPLDSLFCEFAYIIDLDNGVFEAYKGFQDAPHSAGRFADRADNQNDHDKNRTDRYYPVALVSSWPFDSLPTEDEFYAAFGNE